MENFKLCGGSIELLSRALDVRSSNHNVIVSNIANADTPNYKAFHVEVEKEMEKFAADPGRLQMRRTQPAHMPVAAVSEVRGTRGSATPRSSACGGTATRSTLTGRWPTWRRTTSCTTRPPRSSSRSFKH